MYQKIKEKLQTLQLGKINRHSMLVIVAVAAVAVTGFLIYHPFSGSSPSAVAQKAANYLNTSVLQNGQTATVDGASSENGLIKIKMAIGTNKYDMYATADGNYLFPEAFALGGKTTGTGTPTASNSSGSTTTPKTAADLTKADKPMLEAYVVARCPYGMQMQRAMANAIKSVPSLADAVTVRYIGDVSGNTITSMHGDAEAKENMRQICIREEQKPKYWDYVSCQIKSSGTETQCEKSTGIDSAKLNACVQDPSRGLAYAKADFALDAKYNVTGSPTLVLNGQEVSEFDFGGRSPEVIKTLICDASTKAGGFCSQKLDTTEAATAFSVSYAPAAANATAASSGANCAPAS